ncbi:hypothetical protein BJ742DRAFT_777577 [Cladochytrium replicatum]|nr:hypothetical protein BJ742DRAFT_777577 [Cladochytrium replicatum]
MELFDSLTPALIEWIEKQKLFFVASAPLAADGHVNVSPKGYTGSLFIINPSRVAYVDLAGSGIETIAHARENGRITVMFCAFEGPPRIVRLWGEVAAILEAPYYAENSVATPDIISKSTPTLKPSDLTWDDFLSTAPDGLKNVVARAAKRRVRSIIVIDIKSLATSCGYGVPYFDFVKERDTLINIESRVETKKNKYSLDGLPGLPSKGGVINGDIEAKSSKSRKGESSVVLPLIIKNGEFVTGTLVGLFIASVWWSFGYPLFLRAFSGTDSINSL